MSGVFPVVHLAQGAPSAVARGAVQAVSGLLAHPESAVAFQAVRAAAHNLAGCVAESRSNFRRLLGVLGYEPAEHGVRVAVIAVGLGCQLGLSAAYLRELCAGALCHDVGETLVPADLLGKSGALSEAEWHMLRQHPRVGVGQLALHGPLPPITRDAILAHHERVDGSGYPFGLEGADIPLAGRIVGLADCYAGLKRPRPDRPGLSSAEAVEAIAAHAASGFDRDLFRELLVLLARSEEAW